MQRRTRNRYKSGFKQVIINHISENINIYFKVLIIFIIGICIGIIVVNQLPETALQNINEYIGKSVSVLQNNSEISRGQMLKSSLFKNIVIVLVVWLFGLAFVGSFILYAFTLIIGITFGYTIAAIMTSFTFGQGILFFITAMLLQNLINLPAIIFFIVQGIKSHKDLMSKQSNIKYIIAKHSAYAIFVLLLLTVASFIEVYVSSSLVYSIAKYL